MKSMIMTAALLTGFALGFAEVCAAQDDPERRFQEALRVEEGEGARAAVARFEALAADASAPAALRARALLRAGAARERLGDLEGARAAWQRVVTEHAALAEVVQEARGALARLTERATTASASRARIRIEPGATGPDGRPRLNVTAQDGDVRTVLLDLARAAGLNLLLGPEVRGTVTVTLRDVDGADALRTIAESIGDYALVRDASGALLRVNSRDLLTQELELRTYRLGGAAQPGAEAVQAWRPALKAARELLDRGEVRGAQVELDPASRTVFVRAAPLQFDAVREAFGGLLEPPGPPAEGARVSVELVDADVRGALELVAGHTGRGLIIAPNVRGSLSAFVRDLPARTLLAQVAGCVGLFVVVETPAGDLVETLDASTTRTGLEAWPLLPDPASLWSAGGWAVEPSPAGPRHPLEQVVTRLLDTSEARGACAALDPVGHALVLRASARDRAALRAALEAAGYVAPAPVAPGGLGRLEAGTSVRTAIEQVAAGRTNIVVAPNVRGALDGTWRAGAPLQDVLRLFTAAAGEFDVLDGPVVRVVTRDAATQKVETRRLATRRQGGGLDRLARFLSDVADTSEVRGCSVLRAPGASELVATLSVPLLDEVAGVLQALDARERPAASARPPLACVAWSAKGVRGGELQALGPEGFRAVTTDADGATLTLRYVGPYDVRIGVAGAAASAEVSRGRWPGEGE